MKQLLIKIINVILGPSFLNFFLRKLRGGYFSLNELDKQLERFVDYDDGFYVELGANDGVTQSNSLYFETKRNWRGILIEPSPHNFLLCKKQRSANNHFFCNACVSFDYKEKYVDIKYANLMSISENLDLDLTDKDKHIKSAENFLSNHEEVFSFGAVASTLNSILIKSNAPRQIDFLSLDVEGAELDVLKGVDFKEFSFKYMLIEVRDINRMKRFLAKHGYTLQEKFSSHDYLFKKV